ncbi:MAG: CCA tRNA nucleotidyltransferase [Desulfurococcales archaeon]|nr:CCA tRNA nucleotidyltransferase [Desulfurococcales archaeon]
MRNQSERTPLEESILEKLRPTGMQLVLLGRFYSLIRRSVSECLKYQNLEALVEAQGSYAKGTLLSDKWELDVFVLFKGVDRDWILRNSREVLEDCVGGRIPYTTRYAQHPYLTLHYMGLEADLVPAIYAEKPGTGLGVERTPFHTRYVRRKLSERPWLADDVRLLKSFLKGIGAYGAEASIGGFSGYLAELLVIHYGGFRKVLEAAANWRPPIYIDLEGEGDPGFLKSKYRDSPLIVVDPVDPERNAAAAVTLEKLAIFIVASRIYLKRPCPMFFHVESRSVELSITDTNRVLVVELSGDYFDLPRDALLGRLRRLESFIADSLREHGFPVIRSDYSTDEATRAAVFVELESTRLPPVQATEGPPAWASWDRIERFIKKRLKEGGWAWIGAEGSLVGLRPRRISDVLELVRSIVANAPIPRNTSSVRVYLGGDARGWARRALQEFIGGLPAWIGCI